MLSAVIFSVLSHPALQLALQPVHQRYVHPGPLVLGTNPLNSPTPTADRDRTVSRRSEPSSRTTLIGEQPNPWDLLQPQDVMSRHRGAKPPRRYELLGEISLLSPAYLLSVERWPFHVGMGVCMLWENILQGCYSVGVFKPKRLMIFRYHIGLSITHGMMIDVFNVFNVFNVGFFHPNIIF